MNRTGWIGIIILSVLLVSSLFYPILSSFHPNEIINPAETRLSPPSKAHWFGTDQFGRDVFTRVLAGGRISLLISLTVVFLSTLLGTIYGTIAGYLGGRMDQLFMRFLDLLLAFPIIYLALACMVLFGSGIKMIIIVLSLTSWMDIARMIRGEVHTIKQRPFILRTKASGLKRSHILTKHILPNLWSLVVTFSIIRFADIILIESALSFIGIGIHPPDATWGSILSDGYLYLSNAWWITFFPGLAILLAIISLHLIGQNMKKLIG